MKKNFIFGFIGGLLITISLLSFLRKPKEKCVKEWLQLKKRIDLDAHLLNIGDEVIYGLLLLYKPYPCSEYTIAVKDVEEKTMTLVPSSQSIKEDAEELCTLIEKEYKKESDKLGIYVKVKVNGENEVIQAGNMKLYTKQIKIIRLR